MICKQDTHLISMDKQGFDIIMNSYKEQLKNNQIKYIKQFVFFKNISIKPLMQLFIHMKIEKFYEKNIIYDYNEDTNYIYFI